jgi:ribosomal-protein-alanine N-acetyltransferase
MTLPIVTPRLILRRYVKDDVHDLLECVSHPSVAGATPEIEASEAGVGKYIEMQSALAPFEDGRCFDLALERKKDGKVVGLVSLVRQKHRQGEIGWALGVAYRGQGYATEAARALMTYGFTVLDLHRIEAGTNSGNTGSWRVMERLGMRQEARLRDAVARDGEWLDTLIYGTLSREWDAEHSLGWRS